MDNGMIALYGMVGFIFLILMVIAFIPKKASDASGNAEYIKKRMRVKSLKYRAR